MSDLLSDMHETLGVPKPTAPTWDPPLIPVKGETIDKYVPSMLKYVVPYATQKGFFSFMDAYGGYPQTKQFEPGVTPSYKGWKLTEQSTANKWAYRKQVSDAHYLMCWLVVSAEKGKSHADLEVHLQLEYKHVFQTMHIPYVDAVDLLISSV